MRFTLKRGLLAAMSAAALLTATTPVSAQVMGGPPFRVLSQPYYGGTGFAGIGYGGYGYNPGNLNYPLVNPSTAYPAYPPYSPSLYSSQSNPYLGASGASQASLVTNPATGGPTVVTVGDPYVNPYTTNPYVPYYDPVGSYMNGVANIITANANSTVTKTRARLLQEEVFRSQLDTRRRIWEEARYERMSLMNSEQMRLTNIQSALDRARRDPPLTEIWSGLSLNDLFNHLAAQQGKKIQGPTVVLNEDALKHINLTTGINGNAGLLKSEIKWPLPLQRPEFKEPRERLDKLIPEAVRQAKFGPVAPGLAGDIKNDVQKMHDILLRNVAEMAPSDYIEGKRYLNTLSDSARALGDPNVTKYFNDQWTAKGKTVAELVENMTKNGLKFAPAAPGDEWAYRALHHAMTAYDAGMQTPVSSSKMP